MEQGTTTDTLGELLQRHTKSPWAYGHTLLHQLGVNRPGKEAEAAALCRRFAQRWPDDAHDWEWEARWWDGGATGDMSYGNQMWAQPARVMHPVAVPHGDGEDETPDFLR